MLFSPVKGGEYCNTYLISDIEWNNIVRKNHLTVRDSNMYLYNTIEYA